VSVYHEVETHEKIPDDTTRDIARHFCTWLAEAP
jgi:hypothetical protein